MSKTRLLHERISSVMDMLACSAVTEICKLVEDCCGALRVEVFQSKEQIKMLQEKLSLAESKNRSMSGRKQTSVTSPCESPATNGDGMDIVGDEDDRDFKVEGVTGNQHSLWRTVSTAPTGKTVSPTPTHSPPAFAPRLFDSGIEKVRPIIGSCDKPRKQHITSFRVGESPKIKPCTTCCSLYHCPFCQPSAFKPNEFHRVIPHIQSHLRSAVQNDEYVVYNCKLTCRDRPHYHCSYCDHLVSRKDLFIKHLKACRKHARTVRVEAHTSATVQLQEQHSPVLSALVPTTSTPSVEPNSSDVPERTSPGPLDPPSSLIAPETQATDATRTEKTTDSADHGLVARPSTLDPEPSSPELYSGPPTPQIETERTKGLRPLQRDPAPVQVQCNHCGIILNKKNFKVHMRRKHHAEYVAEENEEAFRRYLANSRTDVPPWRRPTRVQCDLCGIRLNKKNFKKHMKRKHRVHVTPLDFQESLDRYLGERGLLVVESSVLCSARSETRVTGGRGRCGEECTTNLFLDIDVGGERGIGYAGASTRLSLETDLASQNFKGETVQIGTNPHRYHGLGKPHLLELPLETLVWIFQYVLRVDGKRAYWNLSLVCRTFRTILRNEIIMKYSTGKRSDPESRQ